MNRPPPDELMTETLFDLHRSRVYADRQRQHAEIVLETTLALQASSPTETWSTLFNTLRKRTKATHFLVLKPAGHVADVVLADGHGLTDAPWPMTDSLHRSFAGHPVLFSSLSSIVALQDHPAIKDGVFASAICCAVGLGEERLLFLCGHGRRHRFGTPDRHILERLVPIICTILKNLPSTTLQSSRRPLDEPTKITEEEHTNSIDDTLITSPSLRLISGGWQTDSGRYEIRDKLGRGGFATVFDAFDHTQQRNVAIKLLHEFIADAEGDEARAISNFRREANITAQLEHPNIIQIFDVGVMDSGQPFIVMEKLTGLDFKQFLANYGACPAERVMPLMIRALRALGVAHAAGIVHRDLKPSNLFLTEPHTAFEDIRVVDFGIASHKNDVSLTKTGHIKGTMRYMAPEYIRHQSISPALDVYQMALILVELIIGRSVVQEKDLVQCMFRHTSGQLDLPTHLMESPLGPILNRGLALQPHNRYPHGDAFADDLETIDPSAINLPDHA